MQQEIKHLEDSYKKRIYTYEKYYRDALSAIESFKKYEKEKVIIIFINYFIIISFFLIFSSYFFGNRLSLQKEVMDKILLLNLLNPIH